MTSWRERLGVWHRPGREVDAELQFHFDERIRELVMGGADPASARAQAQREFGDVGDVRAGLIAIDTRFARKRGWSERVEWLGQDLRYVQRSLRRSPGFVITVVVTLALGLGANAAIYSLLDRLFISPPPGVVRSNQVHGLIRVDTNAIVANTAERAPQSRRYLFSYPELQRLRATLPGTMALGGYSHRVMDLAATDDTRPVNVGFVVGDYFPVLGVGAARGRLFTAEELRVETPAPVAVISDALWHRQFGGRNDVVGAALVIDGQRCTVIGVLPRHFHGADNDAIDLWIPMNNDGWGTWRWYQNAYYFFTTVIVRTATPADGMRVQLAASTAFRAGGQSRDSLARAELGPLISVNAPAQGQRQVAIAIRLAGVASIILLIAMANVINLLLARGARRRREIAVRLALGSGRRVVTLLLMESMVIAVAGGTGAVGVALWLGTTVRAMVVPDTHWADTPINWHVGLFVLVLVSLTGIVVGLVPALRLARPDLARSLRGGARDGVARSPLRTAMLLMQVALSVMLLSGAGLFLRSLRSMESEPTGYDQDRIVLISLNLDPRQPQRRLELARRLPAVAAELASLPAVTGTGLSAFPPVESSSRTVWSIPGRDTAGLDTPNGPFFSRVSPDFLPVMGIRVLRGRGLLESDRDTVTRAVVINATMAQRFWPGADPVNQCLIVGSGTRCSTIVGVVSDAHVNAIVEEPSLQFYVPLPPSSAPDSVNGRPRAHAGTIVLRTEAGHTGQVVALARRQLRQEFAGWATPMVRPLSEDFAAELQPWRTAASLLAASSLLALVVAIVGIYGTVAYGVSQRGHEFGVRVALGARGSMIGRMVVAEGVQVVTAGILIGVILSLAGGRLVQSMLFHTSAYDPAALATSGVAMLAAACIASLVPAWRATRVDPMRALRVE
jgi:predicted permease